MIIGLLDPRWETRHGCSLGLMGLLQGMGVGMGFGVPVFDPLREAAERVSCGPIVGGGIGGAGDVMDVTLDAGELPHFRSPSSSLSASSSPAISLLSLALPQYLVEDIICTGLCLLMLDRFIDLRASTSISTSPAKEVEVEL